MSVLGWGRIKVERRRRSFGEYILLPHVLLHKLVTGCRQPLRDCRAKAQFVFLGGRNLLLLLLFVLVYPRISARAPTCSAVCYICFLSPSGLFEIHPLYYP
jgi:hypothetical protein